MTGKHGNGGIILRGAFSAASVCKLIRGVEYIKILERGLLPAVH